MTLQRLLDRDIHTPADFARATRMGQRKLQALNDKIALGYKLLGLYYPYNPSNVPSYYEPYSYGELPQLPPHTVANAPAAPESNTGAVVEQTA